MSNPAEAISVAPTDEATQLTVATYESGARDIFPGHFANFWSVDPDFQFAHQQAGVPRYECQTVEIGCGDGRDAERTFVPNSAVYYGYDPVPGFVEKARERFADADPNQVHFDVGYAQTSDYPTDTHVAFSVNSMLHVPKSDLGDTFSRVRESLTGRGVLYVITKTETEDNVEVYHDNFTRPDGSEPLVGERVFYHHSPQTLEAAAEGAGLTVIRNQIEAVPTKPWDWMRFAVQK